MKRSIWIPEEDWGLIKVLAGESGLSIGKFIISRCIEPVARVVSKPKVIKTQEEVKDYDRLRR